MGFGLEQGIAGGVTSSHLTEGTATGGETETGDTVTSGEGTTVADADSGDLIAGSVWATGDGMVFTAGLSKDRLRLRVSCRRPS